MGHCSGLTSVTLVHTKGIAVAFVVWVVGNSRSRSNWRLTPVHNSRNVLSLITHYLAPRRDTFTCSEDFDRCPHSWGCEEVFKGCTGLGFDALDSDSDW